MDHSSSVAGCPRSIDVEVAPSGIARSNGNYVFRYLSTKWAALHDYASYAAAQGAGRAIQRTKT